jgi:hypothetical protein
VSREAVRIVVEAERDPSGRLTGSVIPTDGRADLTFSGTLELLACLEAALEPTTPDPTKN